MKLGKIENCRDIFFLQKVWIFKVVLIYFRIISEGWNLRKNWNFSWSYFLKKFEFPKLVYFILGPFLRDEIKRENTKNRDIFFQNVWIFKVVLLYFRIISEGWNLENIEKFSDKNIFQKFEFSKLFYSILGPFQRDEIFEKTENVRDQKMFLLKKFEFSKLFYYISERWNLGKIVKSLLKNIFF